MQEHYHLIGIGGIGMSALAYILLQRGYRVTGSDQKENEQTHKLRVAGAEIFIGHKKRDFQQNTKFIYSTAIPSNNPELLEANHLGATIIQRGELLADLIGSSHLVTVAGSHGKTTSSSLLTAIFQQAGESPSYAIGGILLENGCNGVHGSSKYFVAESDESDGSFLKLSPYAAIITNLEPEHLDYYKTFEVLKLAFKQFANKISNPSLTFWCGDEPVLRELNFSGVSYGKGNHCDLQVINFRTGDWSITFDIKWRDKIYSDITVGLIGEHNMLNAAAVFGLSLSIGIAEEDIRTALRSFKGIARRCEQKGTGQNVTVIDDYAHYPTEVAVTLKAIRTQIEEKKLIVIFQPHRYTRTNECLKEFAHVFKWADRVWVTDIYSAGEDPSLQKVTVEGLVREIKQHSCPRTRYLPFEKIEEEFSSRMLPHNVVVTLGAGDVTTLGDSFLNHLKEESLRKYRIGIICGGSSPEHFNSLKSTRYMISILEEGPYVVKVFGITREGLWLQGEKEILDLLEKDLTFHAQPFSTHILQDMEKCDLFIPVLHGHHGEDGRVQGFLELIGKPYVGCDWRSSAICMDKSLTKRLAQSYGLPVTPFIEFSHGEWNLSQTEIIRQIKQSFKFPFYAKATHFNATSGAYKIEDEDQIITVIDQIFLIDNYALVEEIPHCQRVEFAIFGNDFIHVSSPCLQSLNGEPLTEISEKLSKEVVERGREFAKRAYSAARCTGLASVSCYIDDRGNYTLNEITPFPLFTKESFYTQIWQQQNLSIRDLVDKLIILAIHHFSDENKN